MSTAERETTSMRDHLMNKRIIVLRTRLRYTNNAPTYRFASFYFVAHVS